MSARRPLIAGNWKMNLLRTDAVALAAGLREGAGAAKAEVVVCPVAVHIAAVAQALSGSAIGVGGQDCHANEAAIAMGIPYQALRSLGIDTQLVIYPGQFHGLTIPSYERDRLQRYVNWFNKYLQPSATTTASK